MSIFGRRSGISGMACAAIAAATLFVAAGAATAQGPSRIDLLVSQMLLAYHNADLSTATLIGYQALDQTETEFGTRHSRVGSLLNNIALFHTKQGQVEQAEAQYLRALHIFEETVGPQHFEVANTANNLGSLMYENCRFDEAALYFTRALSVLEPLFGVQHPDVGKIRTNLALVYRALGREKDADDLVLISKPDSFRTSGSNAQQPKTFAAPPGCVS